MEEKRASRGQKIEDPFTRRQTQPRMSFKKDEKREEPQMMSMLAPPPPGPGKKKPDEKKGPGAGGGGQSDNNLYSLHDFDIDLEVPLPSECANGRVLFA